MECEAQPNLSSMVVYSRNGQHESILIHSLSQTLPPVHEPKRQPGKSYR